MSKMTSEYHSFFIGTDTPAGLQVFRNPRRFQNAGSRWILFRTSNGSSDGFRTAEGALAYGRKLNRGIEFRRVSVPKVV